jgi:acyl-CoA thioester hydrolase
MPRVHIERLTVSVESIDMNNHVNNQEYVRWMQDIATAHSHRQGWTVARYLDTKTTWVIRSHYIEYIRPAFMGDELIVATWVAGIDVQTSPRKYRFVRARDGKPMVEAETLWVYCDATTGRPLDITAAIREAFPVVTDEEEIRTAIAVSLAG